MLWHRFERDWIHPGYWFQLCIKDTSNPRSILYSIPSNEYKRHELLANNDDERRTKQSALMKQHRIVKRELTCQCNYEICANERTASVAVVLCNILRKWSVDMQQPAWKWKLYIIFWNMLTKNSESRNEINFCTMRRAVFLKHSLKPRNYK